MEALLILFAMVLAFSTVTLLSATGIVGTFTAMGVVLINVGLSILAGDILPELAWINVLLLIVIYVGALGAYTASDDFFFKSKAEKIEVLKKAIEDSRSEEQTRYYQKQLIELVNR